jgi:hypothetical protein
MATKKTGVTERGTKPTLTLAWLDADASLEDLLAFFRAVTGRAPTPEEIEEVQAEWEPPGRARRVITKSKSRSRSR